MTEQKKKQQTHKAKTSPPMQPYLSSHRQCISVFTRQLYNPYFFSIPPIQNGHLRSWTLQHLSVLVYPPSWEYRVAENPLPHHFVPGTRRSSIASRFGLLKFDVLLFFRPGWRDVMTSFVFFVFNF